MRLLNKGRLDTGGSGREYERQNDVVDRAWGKLFILRWIQPPVRVYPVRIVDCILSLWYLTISAKDSSSNIPPGGRAAPRCSTATCMFARAPVIEALIHPRQVRPRSPEQSRSYWVSTTCQPEQAPAFKVLPLQACLHSQHR